MRMSIRWICLLRDRVWAPGAGRLQPRSADWKSAQAADTTEAYQEFLQQHPERVQ